jgi:hypothetical protein
MAKIATTQERTRVVSAPLEDLYRFFCDPALIREETSDVARFEPLGEGRGHFVLAEKKGMGGRFQADYTIEYTGNRGDCVTWRTLDGNLDTKGEILLRRIDDRQSEIRYRETLALDLPIWSLVARLIRPLVARELRSDIDRFLERVARRFSVRRSG